MKYIAQTFQYMKRVRLLAFFSLAGAIVIGLLLNPFGFFTIINGQVSGGFNAFGDIYRVVSPVAGGAWWKTVVTVLAVACVFSYEVGVIDRHMKTGDLYYGSPFRKINENLFSVMPGVIIMFAAMELVHVLTSLVLALVTLMTSVTAAYLITVFAYILFMFLFMLFFAMCVIWIPDMLQCGFTIRQAFANSLQAVKGNVKNLFLGIITVYIPLNVVVILCSLASATLMTVGAIFAFFVLLWFIPAYMFTSYYEISGMEREDLKMKNNLWNR